MSCAAGLLLQHTGQAAGMSEVHFVGMSDHINANLAWSD